VRSNNPVLFFSGSEEEAKTVVAEYQSGLQLTQTALSAMFDSYVAELSDGSKLPYRLYVPENYDPQQEYPLLVVLHGAGERGNDNESQLRNMLLAMFNLKNSPVRNAIILAPQCPAGQQWVDTPWAKGNYDITKVKESNELAGVVEIVDNLWYEYSIDGDRIYAMGLSMGGFGTWDLLMRHKDVFAAGVPICGGGDPSMADALSDVPIYTFHGSIDTTVPVAGTREMAQALQDVGSTVFTYEELDGMAHGIWETVAARADVIKWLFSQSLADRS
jgi:predicted peptidase